MAAKKNKKRITYSVQTSKEAKGKIEKWSGELADNQKEVIDFLVKYYEESEAKKKAEIKKIEEIIEDKENLSLPPEDKIKYFVNAIMKHNNQAEERDYIYISQRLIELETKCFRPAIKRYLKKHEEVLEQHYGDLGISKEEGSKLNLKFRNKVIFPKTNGQLDYITEILERYGVAKILGRKKEDNNPS